MTVSLQHFAGKGSGRAEASDTGHASRAAIVSMHGHVNSTDDMQHSDTTIVTCC